MALKKYVAKLNDYYARLEMGTAHEFNPSHIAEVKQKLHAKESQLLTEIAETDKPEKIERLQNKLTVARTQIKRADWLLDAITKDKTPAPDEGAGP